MKNKSFTSRFSFIFLILFSFTLFSCEYLNSLLNEEKENEKEIEITKSGLAVNKYLSGTINDSAAEITLYANSSTFHAESGTKSYSGKYVYNSSTKQIYLYSESEKKYYKANVDLSGTKGSVATKPATASFSSSTKTEFSAAVDEVANLPLETTTDPIPETQNEDPNDNPNDKPNEDPNDNPNENPDDNPNEDPNNNQDPQNQDPVTPDPVVPANKTLSTYEDGIRYISFGEKDNLYDTNFVSTIQPRPRPDFSKIDNAVKNLVIPATQKDASTMKAESKKEEVEEDIANAAKLIVKTAGATTIKEKARAIFTWIAYNIDYDYNRLNNTEITAFYDLSTMCDGYSILFEKMCEAVDVDCYKYVGMVAGFQESDKFRDKLHAWNLVCINKLESVYFLVDVTWSANLREEAEEEQEPNDAWDIWFDPDPCYFATSHYSDELGVLVSPEIKRKDFMALPILDPIYELYGIDGKELLEFCYKHSVSNIVYMAKQIQLSDEYPNVYSFPASLTIYPEKDYSFTCGYNGKAETINFTTKSIENLSIWETYQTASGNGLILQYKLQNADSEEETGTKLKDPKYIYYDDQVQVRSDKKFTIGEWNVNNEFDISGLIFFTSNKSTNSYWSAIYDAYYQQWVLTVPSYYSDTYSNDKNYDIPEFPSDPDELASILNQIFTKPLNETEDIKIPLARRGYYLDTDYNEVYIPLSDKENAVNAVENYDWRQDKEFAEFVTWMEKHNVPESQIDFYKEMARYPSQRGSVKDWKNSMDKQRFAGDDYISHSRLYYTDEAGTVHNTYWAGGMQLYFEYRKRETRHLFRNDTIPILLVHIKDTEGAGEQVPVNFFEEEEYRIINFFDEAGFSNKIVPYYVEIEMSYKDFKKKYVPTQYERDYTDWGYDIQWSWKQYDLAWEEILELASKKNPELAQIFADKNKSAMIKYFDTVELNSEWGNINGLALVHGRFDNIMECIGYSTNSHVSLFGSVLKTKAPECFDTNCQRENAVCPLCLYSFDID